MVHKGGEEKKKGEEEACFSHALLIGGRDGLRIGIGFYEILSVVCSSHFSGTR